MKVFISSQIELDDDDITNIRYIFEHSNSIKSDLIKLFIEDGCFVDVKPPPFFNKIKIGKNIKYKYKIFVDEHHLFFET